MCVLKLLLLEDPTVKITQEKQLENNLQPVLAILHIDKDPIFSPRLSEQQPA